MSNDSGPWGREPPQPPPPPHGGFALWLLVMAGLVGLVVALFHAFPEAVRDRDDWRRLGWGFGLILLLSTGLFRASRGRLMEHLKYAAIWLVVLALMALGVAYRGEFEGVAQHLRIAFSDGTPVASGGHEMVVPPDSNGGFVVIGIVNGQRVRFMVDTGASETVLSPDDARRVGADLSQLRFDSMSETANGTGYGARYRIRSLAVGPFVLNDFQVEVNRAPMSGSLLGMTFLRRLQSFRVEGGNLVLRW